MNVNRPLSVAFLTQDFLGPRTHSINYYIARMIYELHTLNVLRNVYIISHKGESYVDRSLHDVMSDHDVSLYPKSIDAFTIDAVGAQSHPSLLHEVDIIICTMYWWGGALHKIYPLVDRPKIIYWVPSLVMHEFVTQRQIPWPGIELQVSLQKKALFSADHLIFNSRADLGRALTYYPKLSASKCNVIYPVSHPLHVCTDNTGCVNRNKDVIGYFGRWEARKGINFVVEAFCRRRIRNHNARLVVVSDYLDRELLDEFNVELCNKVERLVEEGALQLKPWQNSRTSYLHQLAECGLIIIPSLYDPFNIVAYDCALLKMPIILSTFCGACEVIRNDIHDIVRVNPMDHEEMDEAIEVLTTGFNNQPDVAKPWVTYTICEMVQDTLQLMTFAG